MWYTIRVFLIPKSRDLAYPNLTGRTLKLERQIKVFENALANVRVIYTGLWRIENSKRIYMPSQKISKKEGQINKEILTGNFISMVTVLIRIECFKYAGSFDEALPRLQDWELFVRFSKCYEFKYIDEPLVISYFTPNSISSKRDALIKAYKMILDKHFRDFERNRKLLASIYYSIGNLMCQNGDYKNGKEYIFKSIKLNPFKFSYLAAAFMSKLGEDNYEKAVQIKNKIFSRN